MNCQRTVDIIAYWKAIGLGNSLVVNCKPLCHFQGSLLPPCSNCQRMRERPSNRPERLHYTKSPRSGSSAAIKQIREASCRSRAGDKSSAQGLTPGVVAPSYRGVSHSKPLDPQKRQATSSRSCKFRTRTHPNSLSQLAKSHVSTTSDLDLN